MKTAVECIYTFHLPTRIIHGSNSVRETAKEFKSLGATKALTVTDRLVEGILESLTRSGIPFALFDEVEEDPGRATVLKGVKLAARENAMALSLSAEEALSVQEEVLVWS